MRKLTSKELHEYERCSEKRFYDMDKRYRCGIEHWLIDGSS